MRFVYVTVWRTYAEQKATHVQRWLRIESYWTCVRRGDGTSQSERRGT